MELIGALLLILLAVGFLKILGLIFHAGIFVLTLPLKILGVALSALVFAVVLVPLGIVSAIAGLIALPALLLGPLLPILLIGGALYLLFKGR